MGPCFWQEMQDLLHAENQRLKALPKMAKAAHNAKLKHAFETHLEETKRTCRTAEPGISTMFGGIPDCQAQYLRVPYGDVGPIKIPGDLTDEQALFLSNVFPTGVRRDFGALFREGHAQSG